MGFVPLDPPPEFDAEYINVSYVKQLCEKFPPLKQVWDQFMILYSFYKSEVDDDY